MAPSRHCIAALVLAAASIPSLTYADDWSKADTRREVGFFILHAADWGQTLDVVRSDSHHETNPILGEDPSRGEVNQYFLLSGLAHYGISRALPSQYRKWWQRVTIVLRAETVYHNYSIGLDVRF